MDPSSISLSADVGTGAKYRQITDLLRKLIVDGRLKPGTRLPSIKALAKQWDTNYFTVQSALTPLANEGLIERTPRRGTFIRDRQAKLTSVAIYYGALLWNNPEAGFYQTAYQELQSILQERGIRAQLFLDPRLPDDQFSPLPELAKAIERREVQGVIGMMLNPTDIAWLRKFGVPLSPFGTLGIHSDFRQMADVALSQLAKMGCRTAGRLARAREEEYPIFEERARHHGMETRPEWFHSTAQRAPSGEQFGYQGFKALWARQERPEGLIVSPDWECRGAITAILELGVQIPRHLKLIFYRNTGIDYVCPWDVPMLTYSIRDTAATLVDHLETQHRTGRLDLPAPLVEVTLTK